MGRNLGLGTRRGPRGQSAALSSQKKGAGMAGHGPGDGSEGLGLSGGGDGQARSHSWVEAGFEVGKQGERDRDKEWRSRVLASKRPHNSGEGARSELSGVFVFASECVGLE